MTANTKTLVLAEAAGRVAVIVDGEVIGSVKDGGHIVRNVDRVLTNNNLLRVSAYSILPSDHRKLTASTIERGL